MNYEHTLHIDIETYSPENLAKTGVYRYSEDPEFRVLLFGYSWDGGPVHVLDLARGEALPEKIQSALSDPAVQKVAHNASFERVCLSRFLGLPKDQFLSPEGWFCSMVACAESGLPLSLEESGAVLGLPKQKLTEGKDLIPLFCVPHTEKDGSIHRVFPWNEPDTWALFVSYNQRDVETEIGIWQRLNTYPVSDSEWRFYWLDQRTNDRGIAIDSVLVRQAISCNEKLKEIHMERMKELTSLANPASPAQLKGWLAGQGIETDSLNKQAVNQLISETDGGVQEALKLRQELSKSSVSKYSAMENSVCADGRIRGLLQFYGTHTGRWAGRLVQVQNLPQNHMENIDDARALLRMGEFDTLEKNYGSVSGVLSELVRTAFVPKESCRFYVADYSAVEARCLAFLAGESWRMEVFAQNGDIYCKSAETMFHVPVEKNGVNADLRKKGKIAELALGYGGAEGALENMGALENGIQREELRPLVDAWREANPHIVAFWRAVDRAMKRCVREKTTVSVGDFTFLYKPGILFVQLPSGRRLSYFSPELKESSRRFGSLTFSYKGRTAQNQWGRIEMSGPRMVENLVQAYARDLLAEAMLRLEKAGYEITMSVHDEVVIEAPEGTDLQEICRMMGETPSWAEGLVLRADGYVCDTYRKDG